MQQGKALDSRTMSDDVQRVVADLFAAANRADWAALGALAAPDCTCSGLPFIGPPALVAPFAELREAMPDLQLTAEHVHVVGDEIIVRYTGRGVQQGFFASLPPRGASVRLRGLDVLRVAGGKILARQAYTDRLGLLQQMSDPQQGPVAESPVSAEVMTRFDPPTFLEGVLAGPDGHVYVTPLHEGTVYRVRPDGSRQPFFHVDAGSGPWNGVWCMTAAPAGGFFLNVNSSDPSKHGVWQVAPDGTGRRHAALPLGTMPNGIARTSGGDLLVADSVGRVWRVAVSGQAIVWLEHPWLAARPYIGRFPGANGIQVWRNTAYVTNSDLGLIIAIPIGADGTAGSPGIHSEGIGGDDFAIDDDGTMYVTTHPFNSVVRLGTDGSRTVIATASQGVVGPTAAALGRDPEGGRVLYVVTDGGFFTLPEDPPVPVPRQTPALLRLRLV